MKEQQDQQLAKQFQNCSWSLHTDGNATILNVHKARALMQSIPPVRFLAS